MKYPSGFPYREFPARDIHAGLPQWQPGDLAYFAIWFGDDYRYYWSEVEIHRVSGTHIRFKELRKISRRGVKEDFMGVNKTDSCDPFWLHIIPVYQRIL